ncbi:kinetochore protein Nuf2-B [Drosophila eugracilis]|uniref:kinetochore protein Nuf2-B n=1 Tax=Drosophila eugracilis TaxID=29029 RepID=UPI001BDAE1FE|nr:kinetochore protein Nuf2-B [Drosophila eugracilis]
MAVSAEIGRLVDQGNYLMPDINICQNDLANPTEQIVTKIFVHYLRAFGFRLEPPYRIGCDLANSSREARIFLIKVCRQVERILHITFPNKTYTYVDILNPAVKKTLSILSCLFNYLAYYKMFKKNVLVPVEEDIKLKNSLTAEVKAKIQQLQQCKQKTQESEVAIDQLKKELQDTEAKLLPIKKSCIEKSNALELLDQQQTELDKRIDHWEQLVVKDDQVNELREKIKSSSSHIESCKAELASKEQVANEHCRIIETSQQIVTALEKATAVIPLSKLEDYKESSKKLEAIEKQEHTLRTNYQERRQDVEAKKQELSLCDQQYEVMKQKHDVENEKLQKELEKLKVDCEKRDKGLEDLNNRLLEIDQKNSEQEKLHAIFCEQLSDALGEYWQLSST